ncbi:MAG: dihydropteroate synthase [Alicyclobacillaceae bacterium]|nr:dihydropteroate synthase [Alicyclobacillaceae bacterium]
MRQPILIMGIVNITPDSFSDGGQFFAADEAVGRALQLQEEGADIIDLGAESTRPGHTPVSMDEEWQRLEPVLRAVCGRLRVRISVDTYKPEIARRALAMGVDMVNDVSGAQCSESMLELVAKAHCDYVWMHNRPVEPTGDGLSELFAETRMGVERCLRAGIAQNRLWIDPGIGFAKTHDQNLQALRALPEFAKLGPQVLLGISRKRVVGGVLGLPVDSRLEGSLAGVAYAVAAGVRAVRVHDVQASVRVARMMEAMVAEDAVVS